MAVDLSLSPYFDDYDEKKNYHRILFVPGRAVQTRELNQLQRILQGQVGRLGEHIFQEGSMVIPGEFNYNMNTEYVRVVNLIWDDVSNILATNDVILRGTVSGNTAKIIKSVENVGLDPITFYLKYDSVSHNYSKFVSGELLQLELEETGTVFATALVDRTGQGATFTINEGIYFIDDTFIRNDASTIIMGKYTTTPSCVVGFRVYDSTVNASEDPTLYDNASGTTNYNAIGADRYKRVLKLHTYSLIDDYDKEGFVELARFVEGELQTKARGPEYNILLDEMARRTYDESGDYTIKPFKCYVREHLLSEQTPDGLFPVDEGGDESLYTVAIEPGKAYIRGYEIETHATTYLSVDKARDTKFINNSTFTLPIGNVMIVNNMSRLPTHNQYQTISFYSTLPSSKGAIPSGSVLGTARVRWSRYNANNTLEVYLFDIRDASGNLSTGFLGTAQSMYAPGSPAFTAHIQSELLNTTSATSVFRLPIKNVKTLLGPNKESDTTVVVGRQFSGTTDATGSIVFAVGNNEIFENPGSNSSISYTVGSNTVTRDLGGVAALSGNPLGTTLTVNLGSSNASASVVVNTSIVKQTTVYKNKTQTTGSRTYTTNGTDNARISLSKADVFEITSIQDQNGTEHKHKFVLHTNETPELYGISYLTKKAGAPLASGLNLTITFRYYMHGTGDLITVDSYSDTEYKNIGQVQLIDGYAEKTDVVDFRPRLADNGSGFVGAGASLNDTPIPNTLIRNDITYYLPRIDKVFAEAKKGFGVVQGVSADNPTPPDTPEDSMAIYTIEVPAYTRDVKDIRLNYINNRRYTMRDIGKLEDRIANVEYYTTLNMLEAETSALQVIDPVTGMNRFKNGFMVDNFVDHTAGYFSLPEYRCSVSPVDKTLRAEFSQDYVDFDFSTDGSSGIVKNGDLITLPFTERTFLNQPLASRHVNVNPYAVYKWNGLVNLSPSSDAWFDTKYTDPEVTYRVYNNGNLTQQWQSWSLNWTGMPATTTSTTSSSSSENVTISRTGSSSTGTQTWRNTEITTTHVTTNTTTGVTVETVGDRIVSQTAIPFMRSIDVTFTGEGLIPNGRMYAFLDGLDVTKYCRPDGGTTGQPLYTNSDGYIKGVFTIPNNDEMKFRTGTKQFTIIDNPERNKETSLSYGNADFTSSGTLITRTQSIAATKSIDVSTQSSTTTRNVPQLIATTPPRRQEERGGNGGSGGGDPLAQSFFVETTGGVFLTSIDIFFQAKSKTTPVSIEIRDMVNGYPGPNIVPYSEKILLPSQVNVSQNATAATTFKFDSPVYLSSGNEYCFVIKSNSNDYEVWIGTMGDKVINEEAWINKQPYVGVMFKSQNNTTWSEDQESDIKFVIRTARFQTEAPGKAVFKGRPVKQFRLGNNPLSSYNGNKNITIHIPNHGLLVGSRFRISGVDVGPGIPLDQLNKVQTVTEVISPDEVKFAVTGTPNATTDFGGPNVNADYNIQFSTFHAVVSEMFFRNTELEWGMSGYTGKSYQGNEVPYIYVPEMQIHPGTDIDMSVPMLVGNAEESNVHMQGGTVELNGNMISYQDNLSPVIDVNRIGLICINNQINYPEVLEETEAEGGNAFNRYITNMLKLKNAAESIKIYADVYQPTDSLVKVYHRVGNSESEVMESKWTETTNIMSQFATGIDTFLEFEWGVDDMSPYTFYQVKIVLLSKSCAVIPKVKRLRVIALGT